jgi:hypothetical protein
MAAVYIAEPYPRARPPRISSSPFRLGSLADAYDLEYIRLHFPASDAEAIARAELPAGARRERFDELVVIRWASALGDLDEVNRARSQQERWMADHLHLEVDSDYNAAGDRREPGRRLEEHPPLTLYDRRSGIGYKAIAPSSASGVDEEQWSELVAWTRARKLPDGVPLEKLRLIVPTRDLALALKDRGAAAGIEAVLYPDDEGQWWNPRPPGLWLDAAG